MKGVPVRNNFDILDPLCLHLGQIYRTEFTQPP